MKSLLATAASVVLLTSVFAGSAPGRAAAHGAAGGFHAGGSHRGFHAGPRGRPFSRTGGRGRGRIDHGVLAFDARGRYFGGETSMGLGLEAALAYGYADYYGDYEGLPLVAPDYGYPSAFQNGKWPSDAAPAYSGPY